MMILLKTLLEPIQQPITNSLKSVALGFRDEKEAAPHKATGSSLDDSLNRGDHTLHLKGHQKDLV